MSDQELPYPRLQRSALDIFDGLGAIAEQTGSEAVDALGQLAVYAAEHGVDEEAQEWLDRLVSATERVQRALNKISVALNKIPDDSTSIDGEQESPFEEQDQNIPPDFEVVTDVESPEPETVIQAPEPETKAGQSADVGEDSVEADVLQEQGFSDAATETIVAETPTIEVPAQEPQVAKLEKLPVIPELQLSSYESEVLGRVVKFLSQFEERQSLKAIIRDVFDRPRLSRDGEGRLMQILDAFTEAGRLRSYGKTYGYKTEADFRAATTVEIAGSEGLDEVIGEDDRAMLSYIVINAQNGEMNIGEIIRRHVGVQVLPRPQHLELIDKLNHLAELGYLVHAPGSPWYGVGSKLQIASQQDGPKSRWQERSFPQLEQIPLPLLPDEEVELQTSLVAEAAVDPTTEHPVPPKAETAIDTLVESGPDAEEEPVVLDEIMQAVLKALMTGQVFRMEELRENVPLLKTIKKQEYNAFKLAFTRTGKSQIEAYLQQEGIAAELREDGKARGKKYWLEGKDVSASDNAQSDADVKVRVSSRISHPSRGGKQIDDEYDLDTIVPGVIMPDFSTDESGQEVMTMQPIVRRRLLSYVATQETTSRAVGLKMSAVVRIVSEKTGWPLDVAVKVVRVFHKEGDLRVPADRPHKNGTKILTTQAVSTFGADKNTQPQGGDNPKAPTLKEIELRRISELKAKYGPSILIYLNGLEKSQSEFKTAIADAIRADLGEEVDVEDINPVCRLFEDEGLLSPVKPRSRGTGRTLKGTTWQLTSRGRGQANRLLQSGRLTAAQKRVITKTSKH